jgi:acetyltransferase-like isoleucine patch superfamily enzyme
MGEKQMIIKILNRIILKIKREPLKLDTRIPTSYIIDFFTKKLFSLFWGTVFFKSCKLVFLDFTAKVKCKNRISIQTNLSIGEHCYINALSIEGIRFGVNVSLGRYTTIECSGTLQDIGKGLIIGNNVGSGSHGFWGCARRH